MIHTDKHTSCNWSESEKRFGYARRSNNPLPSRISLCLHKGDFARRANLGSPPETDRRDTAECPETEAHTGPLGRTQTDSRTE